MKALFFNPWIGHNYRRGGLFEKRVLVPGEAHYQWKRGIPVTPKLTRDCIRAQITGAWTRKFWTNIAMAFLGRKPTLQEKNRYWHSVSFSNLIQRPIALASSTLTPRASKRRIGEHALP